MNDLLLKVLCYVWYVPGRCEEWSSVLLSFFDIIFVHYYRVYAFLHVIMRVAVIGAGGLTGLECVKQLHATPDHDVVPIVRDPAKYESKLPQGITAIKVLPMII